MVAWEGLEETLAIKRAYPLGLMGMFAILIMVAECTYVLVCQVVPFKCVQLNVYKLYLNICYLKQTQCVYNNTWHIIGAC